MRLSIGLPYRLQRAVAYQIELGFEPRTTPPWLRRFYWGVGAEPRALAPARNRLAEKRDGRDRHERRCRVCGCSDDRACPGGCYWVEADLCSACRGKEAQG